MSAFTLEIVQRGKTPVVAEVVMLPEERLLWAQVEALALQIESPDEAYLRVKDSKGETIIRAGVRTALRSITQCPSMGCPLKKVLARRSEAEGAAVNSSRSLPIPCERIAV